MKIVYLKLVNFIGVKSATGLNEIEFHYDQIQQPIIQLYGKNRVGKTVMIQQHHPFSSINLTGDERSDLSLIIPGEIGMKKIIYENQGDVFIITHTYKPTSKSHNVSSSFVMNDQELNTSGGVNTFNHLVEKHLGINKYTFQFIINGTNLTSFSGMGMTQRKTLLNKAMGIDIYDKIHRLATDDYRYTNKLIASLNHTKEYLLQTYGSYEALFSTLETKRKEHTNLSNELQQLKSRMDALSGMIQTIQQQNLQSEFQTLQSDRVSYKNVVDLMGGIYDPSMYDSLINQQIQLNQQLSQLQAERTILMNDLDNLYDKQHQQQSQLQSSLQAKSDYESMENVISQLTSKITSISIELEVSTSSQFMFSMLSLSQAINSSCKEIASSLKQEHLQMLSDMIQHDVDISSILMQEGASLMDSEKEKSVISYIHSMLHSIEGDLPDNCTYPNCLYRKSYDAFQTYFKAFHSTSKGKFTRYDLEQMDHAFKNIQSIKRIIQIDLPDELKPIFNIKQIMMNLTKHQYGIDTNYIKYMIEQSTLREQKSQYIKQLEDSKQTLKQMEKQLSNTPDINMDDIKSIIQSKLQQQSSIEQSIQQLQSDIQILDQKRLSISQIQSIDINAINKRYEQIKQLLQQEQDARQEYQQLQYQYNTTNHTFSSLSFELDKLEKAFDQYVKTSSEIDNHTKDDERYKIIAEATSSTKGIPVLAIRHTVDHAISTANDLLKVMYDDEITLLRPIIDESQFALPFRCGGNQSMDIRYGSQSESTLLSLALSLSLSASLSSYNIPLIDEIDAYLDSSIRDDFVLMLSTMMSTLKMEQMFLISHNLNKGQFEHLVHTVDISQIISKYQIEH